jgi:hypothetical protein
MKPDRTKKSETPMYPVRATFRSGVGHVEELCGFAQWKTAT